MIEDAAMAARRFWKMQDGPISNVVWLLENRGCIVSRFELHAATLDAFSTIDPVSERPYIILSADKGSAARSRFDVAHELGHLLLHKRVSQSLFNQHEKFKLIENQAHRFASAFLLPAATFSDEFYSHTLDSLRSLKERWRVSIGAMIKRAGQLDLISEDAERRLWVNMGRRNWRTKEPLDDVLEPEKPRLLKRCIEVLVEKGLMSSQDLPLMLGISAGDIENLAALDAGYLAKAQARVALASDEPREPQEIIIQFPTARPK
jgi:Zn-dependent peptidase ImmA (M78 family)